MKDTVQKVSVKIPITLEAVDITTDRTLLRKYRTEIPVLLHNDSEITRHRINEGDLREKLEKLQKIETESAGRGRSPI
jgi:hypothetical protein